MILINLLPDSYRQRSRTPLKYMAGVMAAVTVNGVLLAFWAWTAFGVAAEVESELSILKDTHSGLQGQVAYHRSLEQESKAFQAREDMLDNVTKRRISWTRQTDTLVDIINRGGDGDKYLIWFDDLSANMKENARAQTYGDFKGKGNSGSANFAQVANFLEDVEESELMYAFTRPANPEGSQTIKDEELVPSEVWSFPLAMSLLSPDDRRANR